MRIQKLYDYSQFISQIKSLYSSVISQFNMYQALSESSTTTIPTTLSLITLMQFAMMNLHLLHHRCRP
jgi:hypothetical protein